MKLKFWLNKIVENILSPLSWCFIFTILTAILTSMNTKALILIAIGFLAIIYLIKYLFNKKRTNDTLPLFINLLLCVIFFFTTSQLSITFINRFPVEVISTKEEIAIVQEYYENLSIQLYYSENYQNQKPDTMSEMEDIVLTEFNNPDVTIKYIDKPNLKLAGFVFILNKNTIYINKPQKDEIQNNTITLTHELCHVKGTINEAYTEFTTCKTLLNSSNKYLNFIGARYAVYFLSGGDNTYYDCTQLLVNDYYKNLKG